jgi:hypothetical protein
MSALLGYYAAYGGDSLSTFRENLSVSSLRTKKSLMQAWRWVCFLKHLLLSLDFLLEDLTWCVGMV